MTFYSQTINYALLVRSNKDFLLLIYSSSIYFLQGKCPGSERPVSYNVHTSALLLSWFWPPSSTRREIRSCLLFRRNSSATLNIITLIVFLSMCRRMRENIKKKRKRERKKRASEYHSEGRIREQYVSCVLRIVIEFFFNHTKYS